MAAGTVKISAVTSVTVSGSEGSLRVGDGEAELGRFLTFECKSEEEMPGSSRC